MKRKKIATLLIAGVLALGVVGGSFAWYTSSDKAVNSFSTAGDTDGGDSSINIIEPDWDEKSPANSNNLEPGGIVAKRVSVENLVTYNQFIRVKLTKVQIDANGKEITDTANNVAKFQENIIYDFGTNVETDVDKAAGKWVEQGGYYYYIGKVTAKDTVGDTTSLLLENAKLSSEAGREWEGIKFNIKVDAEAIQSVNNAIYDQNGWALDNASAVGKLLGDIQD